MNKRKLRQMYRKYLFSYSFEVVDPTKRPSLGKYDPKLSMVAVPIKK